MNFELKHFVLVHNKPVEVSFWDWAQEPTHVVKQEAIGEVFISTIFIGLGDTFTGRPYFETMIFGGVNDMYQERCQTWEEAEQQHVIAKALVVLTEESK